MGRLLGIALAAGAASALLVAGVAAGSRLAIPLFYLAPLPVMIAGLAFSPVAAGLAVLVACVGLYVGFGGHFVGVYALGLGGPAFGLSYAALLARSDPAARDGLVWFPVSQLVLLAALFATVSIAVALFMTAGSHEAYMEAVAGAFEELMQAASRAGGAVLPPGADSAVMGEMVARILPPVAASASMVAHVGCLYLAGRAARTSGGLVRPWPDLSALRLPAAALGALGAALLFSMFSSLLGLVATAAAATLLFAFALGGFALVHSLTKGQGARPLILVALWGATGLLGWPVLAMALLGLVDALFDLRSRFPRASGPPAANDR